MSNKGKASTGKEVVVPQTGTTSVPDYIKARMNQGSGLKADVEDFVIPRAKLLHGTSKEPETFNTAKVGEFWANVLDIPLGKEFSFVPLNNRKRVLLMRPIDDKTGESILARADDAKTWNTTGEWDVKLKGHKTADVKWKIEDTDVRRSGLLEFGTSDPSDPDSNPAATVFHDYLIYLPDHPELGPVLLSFARTAAKKAKAFNSKIEMRGGPMTSQKYKIKAVKEGDTGQEYWNVEVQSDGFPDEATVIKCEQMAERYKTYRGADEEGEVAETSGDGGKGKVVRDEKSEV